MRKTVSRGNLSSSNCVVHIDDDELLRITWGHKADLENIKYIGFKSFKDFISSSLEPSLDAFFYVDFCLDFDEMNGVEVLKELFEKGYRNLYLSTGHNSEDFVGLDYIMGTLGKEPPF